MEPMTLLIVSLFVTMITTTSVIVFCVMTAFAILFMIKKSYTCCAWCFGIRQTKIPSLALPMQTQMKKLTKKFKSEPCLTEDNSRSKRESTYKTLPKGVTFNLENLDKKKENTESTIVTGDLRNLKPAPLVGTRPRSPRVPTAPSASLVPSHQTTRLPATTLTPMLSQT